ncbi:MAG: patatin-like phospholipase family protein [Dysgonamonadaceae bacterium]|jgi:NTE family protein|nr:patatin-like phospholipase family protein [Dysgonamonadaceae bacterium]
MCKIRFFIFLILLASFRPAYSQKVGLVLSGGGAKGAVHIGIIKALEDNDIPIDYIAGTSIGAIVGSLYASGYSPEEMLDLFLSDNFYYWQTGKVEEEYQYYFRKSPNKPDFVKLRLPLNYLKIDRSLLPNHLINPIQMNQAFMQLYAQANALCGGDFNSLFVPFLCVASDIFHKEPVFFRSGNLGEAVRASMTFPLVFNPIYMDSVPLFDGGIYDNFPVNPMKENFHPDFIIGSSVTGKKEKRIEEMDLYDLLENMVMQKPSYNVSPDEGVVMNFTLEGVNLLDFQKSETLFNLGYEVALQMIDSIRMKVHRRTPLKELEQRRKVYKSQLPPLIFNKIYISGVNEEQKLYIQHQISREDDHFTVENFKQSYFRLLSNPKIKEIIPYAVWNPETGFFDLHLDIKIDNVIMVAFGGNVSSMSTNQLYLGLGYRSLTDFASTLTLDMQAGNTYNGVSLAGKVELQGHIPMDITGQVAYSYRRYYESEKLFMDTEISTFIHQRETYGKLGLGLPFVNKARMDFVAGYGVLEDRYYQDNIYTEDFFDKSIHKLFSFGIFYRKNTQDAKQYPISGDDHHVFAQYISGKESFTPVKGRYEQNRPSQSWIQLDASIYNLREINSRFNLGYRVQGVLSSKNFLDNYTASVLQAPAYSPTLHSSIAFNEAFRANQFVAGGIIPVWKISPVFHVQGDFHGFLPVYPLIKGADRKARYGGLFTHPAYMGEISLVARLPFMSISLFANGYSFPKNNWNFGLNIGYLIFGSRFIP